jgi:hypothetical protein
VAGASSFIVVLVAMLVFVIGRDNSPESVAVDEPSLILTADSTAADSMPPSQPQQPRGSTTRASGGGSAVRQGIDRVQELGQWRYRPAGDISDRFCQPRPSELLRDWTERVPNYCLNRAQ